MRAKVTCAGCGKHLGVYEKDVITGNDVELYREFAACDECDSKVKILEIQPDESNPWYQFW